MIRLTKERVNDVLAYMEDDLPNCLYLYGDIVRYGVDDPNMTVWYSEKDGKFTAVVMKYFSGSQVYSKDLDYDLDELVGQLRSFSPDRISARREIAEQLENVLDTEYDVEYGVVFQETHYRRIKSNIKIERAEPEDAEEIAALLKTSDDLGRTYDQDALTSELADRMRNKIGRSYVIRDNGSIVAHSSVGLETDSYVIESLTIVREDYRKKMYGVMLDSYMINDLIDEGKRIYGMVVDDNRVNGFKKQGHEPVAQYGKLFKRALDR